MLKLDGYLRKNYYVDLRLAAKKKKNKQTQAHTDTNTHTETQTQIQTDTQTYIKKRLGRELDALDGLPTLGLFFV